MVGSPMKKVRWGHVHEINPKARVKNDEFTQQPLRLRHLTAWRAAHALASHNTVRRYARSQGVKPSSNLSLPKKMAFVLKRGNK